MSYRGTVKNGVVVLEAGTVLPDGTNVRVETECSSAVAPSPSVCAPEDDPVFRMAELAKDTGIPDLGVNLDHYLYGHPKVTDAR